MQFCIKDIEIRGAPLICIYQKFLFFFNLEYHLTSNTICHHPEMVVLRQWSNPYWHMGIRRMQCQRTKKELEMQQRIKNHKSMALRVNEKIKLRIMNSLSFWWGMLQFCKCRNQLPGSCRWTLVGSTQWQLRGKKNIFWHPRQLCDSLIYSSVGHQLLHIRTRYIDGHLIRNVLHVKYHTRHLDKCKRFSYRSVW